ncbi:MAG: alpha/beta hydrolase [Phycisphaerae bacterium]
MMHRTRNGFGVFLVFCLAAAGCGKDYQAMQFLQPSPAAGKSAYLLLGSDDALVKQGRISEARTFTVLDETKIHTWVLRPEGQAKGTVVMLHGMGESKANYLSVGEHLVGLGYNAILPDLRRHGKSDGQYVTHGIKERFDVSTIVDRLLREGAVNEPIYAAGVNLGAVVALQYAAVDRRVEGVMAVDPYVDLKSYVEYSMRLLPQQDRQEAIAEIQKVGSFRVEDASAVNAVRQLKIPLLFAYGVVNLAVPPTQARALHQEASEPKDIVYVEPLSLGIFWPEWMADQIDRLITTKLKGE